MKVYFSASRFYRKEYIKNYEQIVSVLKSFNVEVLDYSKIAGSGLDDEFKLTDNDRIAAYKKMIKLMDKADLCVFEASFPSTLHIGHEITIALGKSKPVIVLYTKTHEPFLFKGIGEQKIYWVEYNIDNLRERLEEAVEEARKDVDVRFNFFVSPKILAFLDWVAQERMIPRSVFLRDLIEKAMKKDKKFNNQ